MKLWVKKSFNCRWVILTHEDILSLKSTKFYKNTENVFAATEYHLMHLRRILNRIYVIMDEIRGQSQSIADK